MTHRFDLHFDSQVATLSFNGRLDRAALTELTALCRDPRREGLPLRVLLGAGTKVDANLLDELVRIEGVSIEAESPYLTLWLRSCRDAATRR